MGTWANWQFIWYDRNCSASCFDVNWI